MIKRRAIWIISYLTFAFLPARAQEHGNAWDSAMNTGLEALQNHDCAKAEQAFQEAVTLAGKLKKGQNDAQFSMAFLLAAQACDAQGKGDEADAEMLARRATDDMGQALKAYHPEGNIHLFVNSQRAAVLFDQAGDIFAADQKPLEAERSYQRVIELLNTSVQANEAAQQEGGGRNDKEEFAAFFLLVYTNPRHKLAAAEEKLARLYFGERKYAEAAEAYEAARKIEEEAARGHAPDGLESAKADEEYLAKHKDATAAESIRKSREFEAAGEQKGRHDLALTLSNLASCYAAQAKYDKAEPLYQRALALLESANWMEKPEAINTMQLYALLLKKTGREEKAAAMLQQAAALKEKTGQN
jgi:Tetratricopeptide repeat